MRLHKSWRVWSTPKNNGDAGKVKTDERMSASGLKPPPKDAHKKTPAKPDSPPKQ